MLFLISPIDHVSEFDPYLTQYIHVYVYVYILYYIYYMYLLYIYTPESTQHFLFGELFTQPPLRKLSGNPWNGSPSEAVKRAEMFNTVHEASRELDEKPMKHVELALSIKHGDI